MRILTIQDSEKTELTKVIIGSEQEVNEISEELDRVRKLVKLEMQLQAVSNHTVQELIEMFKNGYEMKKE